ncbi:hypothetical protein DPMN_102717 [Dreissena polymorpha]|uniref:Uncharacterized protein n=1 Tax=Dreissena polymorpha TaxID=45954 RepID=A0A9D4LL13_DREPO|nr:hypothetical protein DPMN_102717 [Dreissena polymorpha]
MLKQNFGWAWSLWAGAPGLVMGPYIVEIYRIVIRDIQYQFEVNRCRNEHMLIAIMFNVGGDSGQDERTYGQTAEITNSERGDSQRQMRISTDSTGVTMLLKRMDKKASI